MLILFGTGWVPWMGRIGFLDHLPEYLLHEPGTLSCHSNAFMKGIWTKIRKNVFIEWCSEKYSCTVNFMYFSQMILIINDDQVSKSSDGDGYSRF